MKITQIETIVLRHEVKNAVSDSLHTYDAGSDLVTRIHTDEGVTGFSMTGFGRIKSGPDTMKVIIDRELAPLLVGRDPFYSRMHKNDMWVATEYYGTVGVANFAISAIDIAMWDLCGKALGKPVSHLLGVAKDRIPAYAMVGWYFDGGDATFVKQCTDAAEEGFRAVKLKVGRDSLADDLHRIKLIKDELGDEFRVMVDANCIFDEAEAFRRGRAYEQAGVYWFEEPMQPYLRDSHKKLAEALDIPIAIGENYYTRHQFHDVVRHNAADIVQPDARRAGGVTEWLDIAAISEAAGLTLACHGGGPANVNLLCTMKNSIYLETGSLKGENSVLKYKLEMVDGDVLLPDAPGLATDVQEDYIEKHRV
ncbi:MAG: mandelate racemase/muconate lactonizing enzyme family protein [Oscillospiraceae bacterium]|nr:mandelate racemase/muconate lactonizing enzyme family protein [Oscillospiraceae bacterium]